MYRLIVALALAFAGAPAVAAACTPVYAGSTVITTDTTPACLTVSGQDFYSVDNTVEIHVRNDCEVPVRIACGPSGPCGIDEVLDGNTVEFAAGQSDIMRVPFADGYRLTWSTDDDMGTIAYDVGAGDWSGCGEEDGPLPFCQATPGSGGAPGWLGLGLLGLVALRRLR